MPILCRTLAVSPAERDPAKYITARLLDYKNARDGFVIAVHSLSSKHVNISSAGNYIYNVEAEVDYFLPECGQTLEAVVQFNRDDAHIAVARDRLRIIFHSTMVIPARTHVQCVLKEVRYQCGTYRAVAELVNEQIRE